MIVVDATRRIPPDAKGNALPLLLDMSRKTTLVHTDEVPGAMFKAAADGLLNPSRGAQLAHPFYVADAAHITMDRPNGNITMSTVGCPGEAAKAKKASNESDYKEDQRPLYTKLLLRVRTLRARIRCVKGRRRKSAAK